MKASGTMLAVVCTLMLLAGCEVHVHKSEPPPPAPPPPACRTCNGAGTAGCGPCAAKGMVEVLVACNSCAGTGALKCGACAGTGALACAKCKGTGDLAEVGVGKKLELKIQCGHCKGRGSFACGSCTNGRIGCSACAAKGKVAQQAKCQTCGGSGKATCPTCRGKRHS